MTIKEVIPLNDRVLLEPIEINKKYGSIFVSDVGKEAPEFGKVIAIGDGRMSEYGTFVPVNVEVGDIVAVPRIGTLRLLIDQKEYYIAQDREILAKITIETGDE